jgi:hypothetical protein
VTAAVDPGASLVTCVAVPGLAELDEENTSVAGLLNASQIQLKSVAERRESLNAERSELIQARDAYRSQLTEARSRAEKDRALAQEFAIKVESRRSSRDSRSSRESLNA